MFQITSRSLCDLKHVGFIIQKYQSILLSYAQTTISYHFFNETENNLCLYLNLIPRKWWKIYEKIVKNPSHTSFLGKDLGFKYRIEHKTIIYFDNLIIIMYYKANICFKSHQDLLYQGENCTA